LKIKRVASAIIGIGFLLFSCQAIQASEVPKYELGESCSSEYDAAKPKDIYCYVNEVGLYEKKLKNSSGSDVPAGTPITILKGGDGKEFRVSDIALDKKISGLTKENIPKDKFGFVLIGDGDSGCIGGSFSGDTQIRCNWIENFDTRAYKKGQILYLGEKGRITTTRQGNVVTVGQVELVAKSSPDNATLNIGRVPNIEIRTWERYLSEGENCAFLSEEQISPDLVCVEGDEILAPKNPKKSVGDNVYEKTGISLDSTAWFPLITLFLIIIGIFAFITDSKNGIALRMLQTLFYLSVFLLVCAALVALFINIVEPLFSNNTVDFSRKVLGIPTYFYFLPIIFSIILRNNRK